MPKKYSSILNSYFFLVIQLHFIITSKCTIYTPYKKVDNGKMYAILQKEESAQVIFHNLRYCMSKKS